MHVRRRRVRVGYEYEYGLESPLDRPDIASRGRGGLSERLTELERVHTTEPPLFTTVSWVTGSILATRTGFWTASVTGRPGWCPSPTNDVRSPLHDDVSYASSIFPVCTHFAVQLSCHFNDIYILRLLIHAWATQLIRNVLSLPWIPPPAHSDDDGLHVCGGGHVGLTKEEIGLPGGTLCGLRACGSGQALSVDMRRRGV